MAMTAEDILERIDVDHIKARALPAAIHLTASGVCRVELTPNDGTRYEIVVTDAPMIGRDDLSHPANEYVVTLVNCEGRSYYWGGRLLHAGYVQDKWVDRLWSAVVLTTFLNALSEVLDNVQAQEA